jgi:hypothetical protein
MKLFLTIAALACLLAAGTATVLAVQPTPAVAGCPNAC